MNFKIYAKNYRGFGEILFSLNKNLFLVGDNSTGKSSILQLISYVCRTELDSYDLFNESYGERTFDFFSPYTNFNDVTIGFINETNDKKIGRIISLGKPEGTYFPQLRRTTFILNNKLIVLIVNKTRILGKVIASETELEFEEVLKHHNSISGFHVFAKIEKEQFFDRPGKLLMHCLQTYKNRDELIDFWTAILEISLPNSYESGPIRALADKYYFQNRKPKLNGEHFVEVWHDFKIDKKEPIINIIEKFGKNGRLFNKFEVKKIAKKYFDSPLVVSVFRNGKEFSLEQVGVGVSQSLPVLMEAVLAIQLNDEKLSSKNIGAPIVILQQPELHLHPIAQAEMGEAVFEFSKLGLNFAIETHSDFLIDRFRYCFRESTENASNTSVSILFFENNERGNSFTEIDVTNDGKLVNPPESYRDFFINELSRTLF